MFIVEILVSADGVVNKFSILLLRFVKLIADWVEELSNSIEASSNCEENVSSYVCNKLARFSCSGLIEFFISSPNIFKFASNLQPVVFIKKLLILKSSFVPIEQLTFQYLL